MKGYIRWFIFLLFVFLESTSVVSALDNKPPTVSNFFPAFNSVVPWKSVELKATFNDEIWWSGIDINNIKVEIRKWDWVNYWPDLFSEYNTSSSISSTGAIFTLNLLPYWRYIYNFSISDIVWNTTKNYLVFYVDQPEIIINKSLINSSINGTQLNDELICTVKTIWVPYKLELVQQSPLRTINWEMISNWDGTTWVWYIPDNTWRILSIPWNSIIANVTPILNTSWNQNSYTHRLNFWTLIPENQTAWIYDMDIGITGYFDYTQSTHWLIDGVCGEAIFSQDLPTHNLCSSWIASTVAWTWPWAWGCSWENGGATTICKSVAQIDPTDEDEWNSLKIVLEPNDNGYYVDFNNLPSWIVYVWDSWEWNSITLWLRKPANISNNGQNQFTASIPILNASNQIRSGWRVSIGSSGWDWDRNVTPTLNTTNVSPWNMLTLELAFKTKISANTIDSTLIVVDFMVDWKIRSAYIEIFLVPFGYQI